uniref:ZP domain-containing protein n=1 Tax=Heterorhabditis bacteriophora TaxID=37862 RepID=A0A1I7W8X1_HETBA
MCNNCTSYVSPQVTQGDGRVVPHSGIEITFCKISTFSLRSFHVTYVDITIFYPDKNI